MAQTAVIFSSATTSQRFVYHITAPKRVARTVPSKREGALVTGRAALAGHWSGSVSNSRIASSIPLGDEFAVFADRPLCGSGG